MFESTVSPYVEREEALAPFTWHEKFRFVPVKIVLAPSVIQFSCVRWN